MKEIKIMVPEGMNLKKEGNIWILVDKPIKLEEKLIYCNNIWAPPLIE